MDDFFLNDHVRAAIYVTDLGQYMVKIKDSANPGGSYAKSVRETVVAAAFRHISTDSGWIPSGILRVGTSSKGSWYLAEFAAGIRKIRYFDGKEFLIPVPRLLLASGNRTYRIFALQAGKITEETTLFMAPFPNIHGNGAVCWGQNAQPKASPTTAGAVMNLFFSSTFNRDLSNGKCKSKPENVMGLLESLDGAAKFPEKELIKVRPVKDLIAEFMR